jgi:hypothetical protein
MEKENKKTTTIQLDKLLTDTEIKAIANYFEKKDLKGAKSFLNVPERKALLESKGISADYLYYQLEYVFSVQQFKKK